MTIPREVFWVHQLSTDNDIWKLKAIQRCSAISRVWPWTLTYQNCLCIPVSSSRPILTPKIKHVH